MAVDLSRIGGLWLVYGIPGTGKTLIGGLADGLVPAVRAGRTVFTNISGLSVAGIASVTDVPPVSIDFRYLDTVQDIITAFDDENTANSLFILDEMKQVLAVDKRSNDWLCQRLNIMRKRSVDFIMIAQVPEYFSDEIRKLAKGCTLYKRCFAWGSKNRTQEFRFDGGDVVARGGKLQPNGYRVRRLPQELFMCYKSGLDGLIGVEDNGRTNSVWRSPKAIIGYLFVFFVLLMLGFGVFMFFNIKNSVSVVGNAITGAAPVESVKQVKKVVEDEKEKICFTRKICDSEVCKTDAGEFTVASWSSVIGGFLTPQGVVFRCPGN